MDKITQDKTPQGSGLQTGSPKEPAPGELRQDVKRATLVTTIIFIAVWLIVFLVASDKGAFGPGAGDEDIKKPLPRQQLPAQPGGFGG